MLQNGIRAYLSHYNVVQGLNQAEAGGHITPKAEGGEGLSVHEALLFI